MLRSAILPILELELRRLVRFALIGAVLSPAQMLGQSPVSDVPAANPGRPTVSTPATLTPVGYLQFETGGLYAQTSPEFTTRCGVNQVTKLAITSRLQFLALFEPLVHPTGAEVPNRPGELFAGLQGVVIPGEGQMPTVSLSYIRRLYASPSPKVDIGTFRQSATILVSDDPHGFHFDLNGVFTEQTEGAVRRGQFAQTLSLSHSLGRFTLAGKLWHFTQPLTRGNAVGNLWALSCPVRKNLVVDGGFDHGLTSSSTQWEEFVGFTYLLHHRLWKSHKRN